MGSMYRTAGIPTGVGHSSTELVLQPRNPLVLNFSLTRSLHKYMFSLLFCLIFHLIHSACLITMDTILPALIKDRKPFTG